MLLVVGREVATIFKFEQKQITVTDLRILLPLGGGGLNFSLTQMFKFPSVTMKLSQRLFSRRLLPVTMPEAHKCL